MESSEDRRLEERLLRFKAQLAGLDLGLDPDRPQADSPSAQEESPPAEDASERRGWEFPETGERSSQGSGLLEDILRLQAEAARLTAAAESSRSGRNKAPDIRIAGLPSRQKAPLGKSPLPPGRRWAIWALALAAAGAAVFGVSRLRPVRSSSISAGPVSVSISFPAEHPCGLALADGAFLSLDAGGKVLVVLDPGNPRFIRKTALPGISAGGIAAGRGSIWTLDPSKGRILQLNAETCEVLSSAQSPGPKPESIHIGPSTLWTTDASTSKVYRHALDEELSVVMSADLPREPVVGMARAGNHLYVAFGPSRTLRRFDVTARMAEAGGADLSPYLPAGASLTGLALDKAWVWALTESPAGLTRISREDLRFR